MSIVMVKLENLIFDEKTYSHLVAVANKYCGGDFSRAIAIACIDSRRKDEEIERLIGKKLIEPNIKMPTVETCLLCGLKLMWVPNDRPEKGEFFHLFTSEGAPGYNFIHRPVPALQLDMFEDRFVPAQGWSGEHRKVSA